MSFPVSLFQKISFEQITDTRMVDERYYRNRQRGNKAPFFMISCTTIPLDYEAYMAASAKIESYESGLELFTLPNPFPITGTQFPDYNLNATVSAGVKSVVMDRVVDYKVGQFIQFSSHSKVYRIADTSSNGVNTTVSLTCPLLEGVLNTDSVTYGANVLFQLCVNDQFTTEVEANNGKFSVIDVELIEQA